MDLSRTELAQTVSFLQSWVIFSHWPQAALERFVGGVHRHTLKRGDLLHEEGQPSDKVYFITKGRVLETQRVYKRQFEGYEKGLSESARRRRRALLQRKVDGGIGAHKRAAKPSVPRQAHPPVLTSIEAIIKEAAKRKKKLDDARYKKKLADGTHRQDLKPKKGKGKTDKKNQLAANAAEEAAKYGVFVRVEVAVRGPYCIVGHAPSFDDNTRHETTATVSSGELECLSFDRTRFEHLLDPRGGNLNAAQTVADIVALLQRDTLYKEARIAVVMARYAHKTHIASPFALPFQ